MIKFASILAGFSLLLAFASVAQANTIGQSGVQQGAIMAAPLILHPQPHPRPVILHPTHP